MFTASDLVDSLAACQQGDANIISMSLGGPVEIGAEHAAVRSMYKAGILTLAAAGNTAERGNYGYDEVMSVGAMDENCTIAVNLQQRNRCVCSWGQHSFNVNKELLRRDERNKYGQSACDWCSGALMVSVPK